MFYSPKTSADGLVFNYDTGNTVRSYLGEPTTNTVGQLNSFSALDLYTWASSGNTSTWSRDTTAPLSPVKGIPLKEISSGTDSYSSTYNNTVNNISAASSGQTWTVSVYALAAAGTNIQVWIFGANSSGNYIELNVNAFTATGVWQRISVTMTFTNGSTAAVQARVATATNGGVIWWDGLQMEQKTKATQFTTGTRSVTQGLKDLTGRSTIDLSNVSFDSNAQPTWDGTDDQIAVTGFTQPTDPNIYSVEAVVKLYTHNPGTNIGSVIVNNYSSLYGWIFYLKGPLSYLGIRHHDGASGGYDLVYGTGINLNQFYHIVATDDKTTVRLYLNGIQVASRASATALNYSGQPTIGQFGGNFAVTNGEIPVVKIYNKTLTASEVQQNFNAVRGRYGI